MYLIILIYVVKCVLCDLCVTKKNCRREHREVTEIHRGNPEEVPLYYFQYRSEKVKFVDNIINRLKNGKNNKRTEDWNSYRGR